MHRAAREGALAALEHSKDRDVVYGAAFALAFSGESSRAQTLADDLERRFPEDTAVKFMYLPPIRTLLALNRGDPAKAIDVLKTGASYDLGLPHLRRPGRSSAPLYPDLRARPGLSGGASGRRGGRRNSRRFSTIVGIVVSDPDRCAGAPATGQGPTCCRAIHPKPGRLTRISSRCGKTPTRTSPFSRTPEPNTRSSTDRSRFRFKRRSAHSH